MPRPLFRLRYPDYDVFDKDAQWDEPTRELLERRVRDVPPIRFFTAAEAATLRALAETLLPQDDRPERLRIPLVEKIDEALHRGAPQPQRHEDMPPNRELWNLLARALDHEARAAVDQSFAQLHPDERERLVARLQAGETSAPEWRRLDTRRTWTLVLEELVSHYYAHPWAWNEIGFGGPKFPRIYPRTMRDNPDEPTEAGSSSAQPPEATEGTPQ